MVPTTSFLTSYTHLVSTGTRPYGTSGTMVYTLYFWRFSRSVCRAFAYSWAFWLVRVCSSVTWSQSWPTWYIFDPLNLGPADKPRHRLLLHVVMVPCYWILSDLHGLGGIPKGVFGLSASPNN